MLDCKSADAPVIQNLKLEGSPDDLTVDKEAY
jgi:hypothetical protein